MEENTIFGFRGDNSEFLKMAARKLNLSDEGIRKIEYGGDVKQMLARFKAVLDVNYPGAKIKYNSADRMLLFEAFVNADLETFAITKVVMPKGPGQDEEIVVPQVIHLKNPLSRINSLF